MRRTLSLIFLFFVSSSIFASPVNINSADAEQIANSLKGIGPSKAAAIIQYRAENGPFKSADELSEIKGIGKKTIDKNREDIIINSKNDMNP